MKFSKERISDESTLFIPILSKPTKHWSLDKISFIYCYALTTHQEYIINLNHNDANCGHIPNISEKDFVYNAKYFQLKDVNEAKILIWLQNNEIPKYILPTNGNINCYPIVKLYPFVRSIKDEFIICHSKFQQWEALTEYSKFQYNLSIIESNGLFTNNGYEHSEYNLYTLTGRPSNHFNQINYAALNKDNGSRERFISRFGENGVLIEFDLRAFHIFLLSNIVKYEWPDIDIYQYFAQFYPSGTNSKDVTFRQLYGGIEDEYLQIEFFKKVKELTTYLYKLYKQNKLKSILFNRNITIPNLTDVKVLNYILQSFETEFNAAIISEINKCLYNKQSKLILYTYDSFLIDLCKTDGSATIVNLKQILKNIPYRLKYGKSYNQMLNVC